MTEFVQCRFPGAGRPYSYENATGEALAEGDKVIVETRNGEAEVEVVGPGEQPMKPDGTAVVCKRVLRRASPKPETPALDEALKASVAQP